MAKTIIKNLILKTMKKIILILSTFACLILLDSCEKTKDPGATSAVKMANEWWVTLDQGGTHDVYGIGHFKISTYNTSENDDKIWVDDDGNGYGVKAMAVADYSNLTFTSSQSANELYDPGDPTKYPQTVNITDGKVLVSMGHSKTGIVVDSIHMKIEFSDDPGTIYEMNGVARSRFDGDDY